MWLRLLPLFLFAAYALAQGDDTIGSLTFGTSNAGQFGGVDDEVRADIDFVWKGEAGHNKSLSLNNITMELISGKAEDKGTDVVDIIVVNYSTSRGNGVAYTFHPGTPEGPYHVRMNGTIFNGDTSLSSTVSVLSNTATITESSLPCVAGTWTHVRSLTDPAYSPLRLTLNPSFFSTGTVFPQAEVSGPGAAISVDVSYVDLLFDDTGFEMGFDSIRYNATAEVLNTVTGFNAGVQAANLESGFRYSTSNFTLDPGSWKVRMNYSDKFFVVVNESQPECEQDSASSSSKNAARHGGLPWGFYTGVSIGLLLAATYGWF
ncbi:hypothetical protein B0H19DRAFT_1242823 [Mycena capillaripes]|nr:hypothetical protein B0H19DRAFT_1242823 [Mycena capillaripes]